MREELESEPIPPVVGISLEYLHLDGDSLDVLDHLNGTVGTLEHLDSVRRVSPASIQMNSVRTTV